MKKKLLLGLACCIAATLTAQTVTDSFLHDGIYRNYRLHLPPNLQPGEHLPLVFNLHGFTSNAQEQELYAGMNAVADTARFLVCYANGLNNAWSIGVSGGSTADDVGFLSALIDTLQVQYGINPGRVYSCGMSNGGFMSYRLACELSNRIAAIASITGAMTSGMVENCQPARPVPVLEIHGNADPIVSYNGGFFNVAIPDVIAFWVAQNDCPSPPAAGDFPNTAANDQATASYQWYTGCGQGSEVELITVNNGGHTWPGAPVALPYGPTCQDFEASVEIWNFFNRFALGQPSATHTMDAVDAWVTVSPNPFREQLFFKNKVASVAFLQVFDPHGQLVAQQLLPAGGDASLDTAAWPAGMYQVLFNMKNKRVWQRVVKM